MTDDTEGKEDVASYVDGVGLELARTMIGDLVLRAAFMKERIPITRFGKRVAALVSAEDLERLNELDRQAA